jgi:FkbM family methyltransferase
MEVGKWYFFGGDFRYLTNHPLNENSVVFDVGGYIGVFSDKIIKKYNPYVYIFEPVEEYVDILKSKYKDNNKVVVVPKGLSDTTGVGRIQVMGEESSAFINNGTSEEISYIDIYDFYIQHMNNKDIDLISINIEGGEYPLIERIVDTGLIDKMKFIQVQFHQVIQEASLKRADLVKIILNTHKYVYSFPFVWEGFERLDKE